MWLAIKDLSLRIYVNLRPLLAYHAEHKSNNPGFAAVRQALPASRPPPRVAERLDDDTVWHLDTLLSDFGVNSV